MSTFLKTTILKVVLKIPYDLEYKIQFFFPFFKAVCQAMGSTLVAPICSQCRLIRRAFFVYNAGTRLSTKNSDK